MNMDELIKDLIDNETLVIIALTTLALVDNTQISNVLWILAGIVGVKKILKKES